MNVSISNLWFRYETHGHDVLRNISVEFMTGSYWCILGPNGSGKSTLLKLMAHLIQGGRQQGELCIAGTNLFQWKRKDLAKNLAYVPSTLTTQYPLTVRDFVLQGRFPHHHGLSTASTHDHRIAMGALQKTNLETLADLPLMHLSAGERQLALIAHALVQEPKVLLLDETTSNLDLNFQLLVFKLLTELNQKGVTIIIVCHDLNLAAEFCPQALWIRHGEIFKIGSLKETFTTDTIKALYPSQALTVGENPFTKAPKIFFHI